MVRAARAPATVYQLLTPSSSASRDEQVYMPLSLCSSLLRSTASVTRKSDSCPVTQSFGFRISGSVGACCLYRKIFLDSLFNTKLERSQARNSEIYFRSNIPVPMGDLLDELADIIEDGGAYLTGQPAKNANYYSTTDRGLNLDDFGTSRFSSAMDSFANETYCRPTPIERRRFPATKYPETAAGTSTEFRYLESYSCSSYNFAAERWTPSRERGGQICCSLCVCSLILLSSASLMFLSYVCLSQFKVSSKSTTATE